ncbi:hypothetical protein N2152v2_001712 [Parachlorella kessleri]
MDDRPRDAKTDAIIQQALKDEEAEKKQKKQFRHQDAKVAKVVKKGKTLEQIEAEEGGPVKESLVGMAQKRRAAKRKGAMAGDTDLVEDLEGVEEELEADEDDGIQLEAFNLKEERRRGHFDESGNYVEGKDEDDVDDAWLKSEEAKVVTAEVRRKIEAQQRQMEAAEGAAPLTAAQIARLQFTVSQCLLPGETVTRALKRLGGHSRTVKRQQKRGKQEQQQQPAAAAPSAASAAATRAAANETSGLDPAQAKEQFDKLTEAVSNLMDAGETDVYTQDREYFERAAAVYLDLPGPSNVLDAGPSKAAYEDADEDMFASDDEGAAAKPQAGGEQQQQPAAPPQAGEGGQGRSSTAGPAPPASGPPAHRGSAAPAGDGTDYDSWPIKELRRFLTERGQDAAGIIDKADLVTKVKEVAAADSAAAAEAPPGYAFDPASGYWYSSESGLYWDASSGGFYNGESGKWYSYDASKQEFVEWTQ